MKGHLTSHYSTIFEKRGVKKVPHLLSKSLLFVREVYKSRKLSELASFMVWELFHKFGLFPKKEYLEFNSGEVLTLENERLKFLDSSENVGHFFRSRGLSLVRSYQDWRLLFINNNKEILGCLHSDDKKLYKSIDNGKSIVLIKEFP